LEFGINKIILRNKSNIQPLVSVCIITYNQQNYIEQAIISAINQDTNFMFEIVIGDDCSTDNTREILLNYSIKYPDKVSLIFNENNLGPVKNMSNVIKNCKGKYIALLEGDDYWSSVLKLKKQVDFLERNSNFSICYHATNLVDSKGDIKTILPIIKFRREKSTLIDLIENDSFMATCSVMFKNNLFEYFPEIFYTSRSVCDWSLNVLNAEHGDIGYINEVMSVYRSASGEHSWSSKKISRQYIDAIKLNEAFNEYFNYEYEYLFKKKISSYYYIIAVDHFRFLEFKSGFYSLKNAILSNFNIFSSFKFIFILSPFAIFKGILKKI
jgi:glycosyltransferase involved in cell wall biosynthesis